MVLLLLLAMVVVEMAARMRCEVWGGVVLLVMCCAEAVLQLCGGTFKRRVSVA